ncbi:MAG TPA: enolase C-terminal domain-like protein [Thermohalobaculum sp.]|nr:enolase C-terminal domain-like protein [Thermohalobaculum sp.]
MTAVQLRLMTFPARFRMRFTHGSATRSETENVVCIAHAGGLTGYGEGCPRGYVTGETIATATRFFEAHRASLADISDLPTLRAWIGAHGDAIDANPAAFAAIEIALIDLFAQQAGQGVEAFLGLPPPRAVIISAALGVTGRMATAAISFGYRAFGMTNAKVKLSPDPAADRARLTIIRRTIGRAARLRVDANNLFQSADDCTAHLKATGAQVWAIEEPLAARDYAGMRAVASMTGARIILDESGVRPEDLANVEGADWIVNLRVSKHGGLLRSLDMLQTARQRGLGVILGCHVGETSILSRAALALAAACGVDLIAMECAYGGYLLAHDLTEPRIRFGRGGIITAPADGPGLGVTVLRDRLVPVT